jgi:hypothetical protein
MAVNRFIKSVSIDNKYKEIVETMDQKFSEFVNKCLEKLSKK